MKVLIKQYNCVAPCLRGYGYSSNKEPISSLKDLATDLALFMQEEMKVKDFYIFAHGMGCMIAVHLANILPSHVKGIIFQSAPSLTNGWKLPSMKQCTKIHEIDTQEIDEFIEQKKVRYF